MRILGLDIGDKRIGVAISDETTTIASGLEVIKAGLRALDRIEEIISRYDVKEIVVGLPLNMDGSRGPAAAKAVDFAKKIQDRFSITVSTFDERLTTRQGESALIAAGISRKKRRAKIDKLAAQIILQTYIDFRKRKE
jgi:putative Holliday junction resolvase